MHRIVPDIEKRIKERVDVPVYYRPSQYLSSLLRSSKVEAT